MGDLIRKARRLVGGNNLADEHYKHGKTKLFLKLAAERTLAAKQRAVVLRGHAVNELIRRVVRTRDQCATYNEQMMRGLEIGAYARGFMDRLVISKRNKRKRALWGVVLWVTAIRRSRRDRLAALTFQTSIRELLAMRTLVATMERQRHKEAINHLYVLLQSMQAKQAFRRSLAQGFDRRKASCAMRITYAWLARMRLREYQTWTAMCVPARRLVRKRVNQLVKLQARFRGIMLRRTPIAVQVKQRVRKVQADLTVRLSTVEIQRSALASNKVLMLYAHWEAAGVVQYNMKMGLAHVKFQQLRRSAVRIQADFRGWLVRALINWSKLRVLATAEEAQIQRHALLQRKASLGAVGARPTSVVDVRATSDLRLFYPGGWMRSYGSLLRLAGPVKLALGAEHTMALTENRTLFAWGSDEVGQLGLTEGLVDAKGERRTHTLMAPILKHHVLDVACGQWHTVALLDGADSLWAWGMNHRGQCGIKSYLGPAFTPTFPKTVRAPEKVVVSERATAIAAGPFASAAIVGDAPYVWGESHSCGQDRDVRTPMRIGMDRGAQVVLGDGFGLLHNPTGVLAWGKRCAQMGIGAVGPPVRKPGSAPGFLRVNPLLRFDQYSLPYGAGTFAVPVPIRLPREAVHSVSLGTRHVAALTASGVYEWGVRHLVRAHDSNDRHFPVDQDGSKAEIGNIQLPVPVRLDLAHASILRAGGDVTVCLFDEDDASVAWSFLETTKREDLLRPAQFSYRMLRRCEELRVAASSSLTIVYGRNQQWPVLDRAKMEALGSPRATGPLPTAALRTAKSPDPSAPLAEPLSPEARSPKRVRAVGPGGFSAPGASPRKRTPVVRFPGLEVLTPPQSPGAPRAPSPVRGLAAEPGSPGVQSFLRTYGFPIFDAPTHPGQARQKPRPTEASGIQGTIQGDHSPRGPVARQGRQGRDARDRDGSPANGQGPKPRLHEMPSISLSGPPQSPMRAEIAEAKERRMAEIQELLRGKSLTHLDAIAKMLQP